jgi:hypothetical protein
MGWGVCEFCKGKDGVVRLCTLLEVLNLVLRIIQFNKWAEAKVQPRTCLQPCLRPAVHQKYLEDFNILRFSS